MWDDLAMANRLLLTAGLVGMLVFSGCGSDGGDADSAGSTSPGETTTVATSTGGSSAAPATTGPATGDADDLEGTWTSDVQSQLAQNTVNLGTASLDCNGTVTLTIADGHFRRSGTGECTAGPAGISATAVFDAEADYDVSGGEVTLSDISNHTSLTMGGRELTRDFSPLTADPFTASVDGDTLSLTFTDPSVGTVTQTYRRAA